MAMSTLANPASNADRYQIYLDTNWFKALDYQLKFYPFGVKRSIPANAGHTSVRYFRSRRANTTGINTMGVDYNEGVVPTTLAEVQSGYVDAYVNQKIWYAKISDVELATDPIDVTGLYSKKAGADTALDFDEVCANSMFANPAVAANKVDSRQTTLYGSNGYFERFAGVANTGNSANDFATLAGGSASAGKLTRAFAIGCATQLEENDVPMINNRYVGVTAPRVINDMRQDQDWFDAAVFNAEELKLFKGGEFVLDGIVYSSTTRAYREAATYGTRDNTGSIFGIAFMGAEAFVVPRISSGRAGGAGDSPVMTFVNKADHSNPANQFASITAKVYYGSCLILTTATGDVPHVVLGRVKSTFSN